MPHLDVQLHGNSPAGEVWSTSMQYAGTADGAGFFEGSVPLDLHSPARIQSLCDDIAAVITDANIGTQLRSNMSDALSISTVKLYLIDINHVTAYGAEASVSPARTGTGSLSKPLQTSMVITRNTGAQYGKSGRGRAYWPFVGPGGMSGPYITPTIVSASLANYDTLQAAIGTAINAAETWVPAATLVTYSRKLQKVWRVNNLSADNVPDTQNRRRDRLPRTRTTITRS